MSGTNNLVRLQHDRKDRNLNKISAKAKLRVQFGEVFLSFRLTQFVLSSNNIKHENSNFICCLLCKVLFPFRSMLIIVGL